jgi:hypothetical protein
MKLGYLLKLTGTPETQSCGSRSIGKKNEKKHFSLTF